MRAHHARQFVITEFHAHYALPAANKGIGFGIAKLLAEQGLTTVVAARNGQHVLFACYDKL